MQAPPAEPAPPPPPLLLQQPRSKSASSASSAGSSGTTVFAGDLKCPELLVRGTDLQLRVPLESLLKKGKRFESGWSMYLVAVYANVLFYYEHADELPRGVMPLAGCSVKAVDRIFRNSDAADPGDALAEDCGPCWKLTSSAGRVLLFRSRSSEDRQLWIDRVNQANVEHPAYRRRLSGRRGSLDAAQGRRRRTSRLSLDESQRAAAQPPPTTTTLHRHSDASAAMLIGHEVSGMLRDAMQIVKRQKQEILELTRKLHELQAAQQQLQAVAGGAEETAAAKPMRASLGEAERPAAAAETPDKAARRSRGSKDVEIDCIVLGDDEAADAERVVVATVSETRAVMEPARVREDSEAEDAAVATTEAVPPAPHSAPAQLEHAAFSESDNLFARVTTAVADASAALSASVGAGTFSRASYSGGSVETDYLQQQAMELAEIARSLQSSFRTDFPIPSESAPSSATTYIDSFGQRNSTTDMLSNDMFSFDDDNPFGGEDDLERLSEFDESDEHFLEASGILDSIQQVMNDFIVTSAPEKEPGQIIIGDDAIAEIRQGIERKEAEEAGRLRQLRSLSDFHESSGSAESDNSIQRAKSARSLMADFGSGGSTKMSRPRRDLGTLLVEESMTVVSSVLQAAGREEKMVLLYPLLRLFGIHNRLSRLIRWAIEIEVASVINVVTLFRSDDYASRLVSSYSKCVGMDFIRIVLADPIRDILTLKIADLELNPNKSETLRNESAVLTNAANLMRACQHILDAILRNAHLIPMSYYHICSHLNARVIKRFDGSTEGIAVEDHVSLTRSVIGGFLFLRFVCPAIATPHLYNLTEKEPPSESRRVLVLVTKLLFKTATCVMFGEREPQFKILNPFIERNSPLIQQLFIDLSQPPSKDIDECFASDSRSIFSDVDPGQLETDMTLIRSVAEKNLDEIAKRLAASGFPPQTTSELKVAVLAPSLPRESALPYLEVKLPKAKKLSVNKFLSFGKKMRRPLTDE